MRRQLGNAVNERGNQRLFKAVANMWGAKRIDGPEATVFPVGNQGTDTDNRMIDVLRDLSSIVARIS